MNQATFGYLYANTLGAASHFKTSISAIAHSPEFEYFLQKRPVETIWHFLKKDNRLVPVQTTGGSHGTRKKKPRKTNTDFFDDTGIRMLHDKFHFYLYSYECYFMRDDQLSADNNTLSTCHILASLFPHYFNHDILRFRPSALIVNVATREKRKSTNETNPKNGQSFTTAIIIEMKQPKKTIRNEKNLPA